MLLGITGGVGAVTSRRRSGAFKGFNGDGDTFGFPALPLDGKPPKAAPGNRGVGDAFILFLIP